MANNTQRMWFAIPVPDGIIMARFPIQNYNPRLLPQEQLSSADYLEKMPATEAFELSATLAVAGNMAMKQYAGYVRQMKLRNLNAKALREPADPIELARIATMMEGRLLDPEASLEETQQALLQQDNDGPVEIIE